MSLFGTSIFKNFGFSILFFVLAAYNLSKPNYLEMALYLMAGVSFGLMGLIKEGKFKEHKKLIDIVSWTLIIITVFYFLFMLRNDSTL